MIVQDNDAYFIPESSTWFAQFFLSASSRHPIMFLALTFALENVLRSPNAKRTYAAKITGPGATKNAHLRFMRGHYPDLFGNETHVFTQYNGTRSIRISSNHILRANVFGRRKSEIFSKSNVTHWLGRRNTDTFKNIPEKSCFELLNITGDQNGFTENGEYVEFLITDFETFISDDDVYRKVRDKLDAAINSIIP